MLAVAALTVLILPVTAKEIGINTVYDSVRQGETDWFYEYVSSSSFDVYLIWNNPSNSLTLTIYSPDGTYQTFRDSSDGRVDGKIVLTISNAQTGLWYFKVYGERVSGVQYYSLTVI